MARLYVPREEIREVIPLKSRDLRYLIRVLRLGEGDELEVFDGEGGRYRARILQEDRGWFLQVLEELEPEPLPKLRIVLGQGILKGEKMKWVIQKATELGVSEIVPLETSRSIPVYEEEELGLKLRRWQRIAEEAARQSNRSTVPLVQRPMSLQRFSDRCEGFRVAFWEGATIPLREVRTPGDVQEVDVVIGPEGGFSEGEAAYLEGEGFVLLSLGPRILRAETAAIAVLALLQHLWGDLG